MIRKKKGDGTYSHGGDTGFRKQSFSFFELSVSFVSLRIGAFVSSEISVPSSDYVSVQLGVFKV